MARRSFAAKPVEQLIGLSKHSLNLCDVCKGCPLRDAIAKLEAEAWQDHRQGVKTLTYRCNSFKLDLKKKKIAPPIGE